MPDIAIIRIERRRRLFVVTVDDHDKESFEARDEAEIWAIDWASRNAERYCIYYYWSAWLQRARGGNWRLLGLENL